MAKELSFSLDEALSLMAIAHADAQSPHPQEVRGPGSDHAPARSSRRRLCRTAPTRAAYPPPFPALPFSQPLPWPEFICEWHTGAAPCVVRIEVDGVLRHFFNKHLTDAWAQQGVPAATLQALVAKGTGKKQGAR